MELSAYLEIIRRRLWIIIVTTMVTMLVAISGWLLIPTTFEVSTKLRVEPYTIGDPPYAQLVYAERIMNTYVQIASSSPILKEMRGKLNLASDQPASIEVEVIPNSELLLITVEDQDPVLAQNVANTLAEMLLNERSIKDIRVSVIEPASRAPIHDSKYNVHYIGSRCWFSGRNRIGISLRKLRFQIAHYGPDPGSDGITYPGRDSD
jgi:capsular polysaccharide biosynthesis protein